MKNFSTVLLVAVSFIFITIAGSMTAFGSEEVTALMKDAEKYKDYSCPGDCMEAVRAEGSTLYVYNWAEWWPEDLFKNFGEEFGIKIVFDYYADTSEMEAKFKLNPNAPYDVVLGCGPTNVMTLRAMGLVTKLNQKWLPNVHAYISDKYKGRKFDPNNDWQIPDSGYATNWLYNSNHVDDTVPGFGSWKFLFENEKYAGKMTMHDNMYEAIGAALKYLGYSWNSDIESELMEAKAVLMKQKSRLIAYNSWPRRLLVEGESWISQSWDGDAWHVSRDVPGIKAVLPSEGTFISANTDFIPKNAKHPATAHLFLNYLYRTSVNVQLIAGIGYPPAHKHTIEYMSDEMKAWPGFGTLEPAYIAKSDSDEVKAITGQGKALRTKIWEDLKR
jgi:spermidine/putrescine transport system substrate-binding protein